MLKLPRASLMVPLRVFFMSMSTYSKGVECWSVMRPRTLYCAYVDDSPNAQTISSSKFFIDLFRIILNKANVFVFFGISKVI